MKHYIKVMALSVVFIPLSSIAQLSNCQLQFPVLSCPSDTRICVDETSSMINISNPSGLAKLELAIIDLNQPSTANTGPTVLGFTDNPFFNPGDFNITNTTDVEVIAVAYDLLAAQQLIESIINGNSGGTTCCSILAGFIDLCPGFLASGVNQGTDFVSLNQFLTTLNPDGDKLSVDDIVTTIEGLNFIFGDTDLFPSDCGGGTNICFSLSSPCLFEIVKPQDLITIDNTDHSASTTAFANKIESSAIIQANQTVRYHFRSYVKLENNFTSLIGSVLEIDRMGCN